MVVTNQPHSRHNAGIDLVSGVSALLAWFPASWASKVAQCFIGDAGGATQLPQEVTIQCPNREAAGTQRDNGDQVLQAVKFTDKKVPGLHLDLDEDFQTAGCFTEIIRGYKMGVVEPDVMRGLQPAGATRVTLDVIIPSPTGMTFFFLWYGRSRSKARSLHEKKLLKKTSTWTQVVACSVANQQNQNKPPKTKGETQIPQPDLRLTIQRTAKQTANGARAQQKQPQKICQGHSGNNPLCRNRLKNLQQTN